MTEKQYRLNKWGTRLLKNNRPLFDWTNEADEIVDLLNKLNGVNEQLKKSVKRQQDSNNECAKLIKEQQKENEQLKHRITELQNDTVCHKRVLQLLDDKISFLYGIQGDMINDDDYRYLQISFAIDCLRELKKELQE